MHTDLRTTGLARRERLGLTLVEVLVSVVLLAILAGASLPWVKRAVEFANGESHTRFDTRHLAMVADAFIEAPGQYGITSLTNFEPFDIAVDDELSRNGPVHDGPFIVRVTRLIEGAPLAGDVDDQRLTGWILFELFDQARGRVTVRTLRWFSVPGQDVRESQNISAFAQENPE